MKTVNAKGNPLTASLGRHLLHLISQERFDSKFSAAEMNSTNRDFYESSGIECQRIDAFTGLEFTGLEIARHGTFCGIPILVNDEVPDDLVMLRGKKNELKGLIYAIASPKKENLWEAQAQHSPNRLNR